MKIVYAGTPQFAVRPLEKILDAGFDVAGVLAQPDRRRAERGYSSLRPSRRSP